MSGNIPAEKRNDGREVASSSRNMRFPRRVCPWIRYRGLKEVRGRKPGGGYNGRREGISHKPGESGDFFVREEKLGTGAKGGRDIIGFWAFPELLKFEADRGRGQNENPPLLRLSKNIKVSTLWKGTLFPPFFVSLLCYRKEVGKVENFRIHLSTGRKFEKRISFFIYCLYLIELYFL